MRRLVFLSALILTTSLLQAQRLLPGGGAFAVSAASYAASAASDIAAAGDASAAAAMSASGLAEVFSSSADAASASMILSMALPDAPGSLSNSGSFALAAGIQSASKFTCGPAAAKAGDDAPDDGEAVRPVAPCPAGVNPYRRFVDSGAVIPLSPGQKGFLAVRNFLDPGNFLTVIGTAAYTVGLNAHTAYGPGMPGFRRNVTDSLLQDGTGEFFGVFLIPSLAHEDPHYHRMPKAGIPRRVLHAVSRTVIAQHDDGTPMVNFSTLLTYPVCAEISNLYVPGIHGNGPSTAARVLTGLASDPVDNLVTEFLPDLARHIHVRVIFVQRILNQVATDQTPLP